MIFRRLNAIIIEFYTTNVVHGVFSTETSTAALESQSFIRFWRKVDVISLLLEEFRRLNAIFIAFYTTNVVYGVFSFEKAQQLANRNHLLDFEEKETLFLFCWRNLDV